MSDKDKCSFLQIVEEGIVVDYKFTRGNIVDLVNEFYQIKGQLTAAKTILKEILEYRAAEIGYEEDEDDLEGDSIIEYIKQIL